MTDNERQMLAEIEAVVARVAEVQRERGLTEERLIRTFPQLGSDRSWKRFLAKDYAGLNVSRWHRRLKDVAVVLDGGTPGEVYYDAMPFAQEMSRRLTLLERTTTDRRILCCLAASGCGKSAWARNAVAADAATRVMVRMDYTYRGKPAHICRAVARAMGVDLQADSPATLQRKMVDTLNAQPRTIFLDQAHEAGASLMLLLASWVDQCRSFRAVYLAYGTAFRRVQTASTDALIEAKSFVGRCQKPVHDAYDAGLRDADVVAYLVAAAGLTRQAAAGVAAATGDLLRAQSNLRTLEDAVAAAVERHDVATAECICREVAALCGGA